MKYIQLGCLFLLTMINLHADGQAPKFKNLMDVVRNCQPINDQDYVESCRPWFERYRDQVNQADSKGFTPLQVALMDLSKEHGEERALELIRQGASLKDFKQVINRESGDHFVEYPVLSGVTMGNSLYEALILAGANVNENAVHHGGSGCRQSVKNTVLVGAIQIMNFFKDDQAKKDLILGNIDALLRHGANVNQAGSPLFLDVFGCMANMHGRGYEITPLMSAVDNLDTLKIVPDLLKSGARINDATSDLGLTVLHVLAYEAEKCQKGSPYYDALVELLRNGGNPHLKTKSAFGPNPNQTALEIAIEQGNHGFVRAVHSYHKCSRWSLREKDVTDASDDEVFDLANAKWTICTK